ncbi:hypothetical protein [Phenylobacterium sp.]|uniref:hypothetical protein n=1 Tax=Phenylobacterium sp. TaxID=1871053 RepID=UPI00286A83E5|nr:hypothetical protein [Phenylobacterium sp.]
MKVYLAVAGLMGCVVCYAPLAAGQPKAQAAPVYVAKRTSFGQPSLEGVWASNFLLTLEATPRTPKLIVPEAEAKALAVATSTAMANAFDRALDPEAPGMIRSSDGLPRVRGQRRTRAVVEPADGMLPYTPEARRESRTPPHENPYDNPEDRPSQERCLMGLGPPPLTSLIYANRLQIIQTRDQIVFHTEYGDEVRIISLTDAHEPKIFYSRLGDSIGHWEGDTLIIETIGLPDQDRERKFPTLIVPGDGRVIERLTRVSKTELLYQFTIVDPKTYAAPWLAEFSWFQTRQPIFEHACHEGNYSLPNILAGARHDEASAKAAVGAATR